MSTVDVDAREFVDAIPVERRELFDRVRGLVTEACPDVHLTLSYDMPTFVAGRYRLYVGVWRHGLSFYGWSSDADAGFSDRHPELVHGRGTMKLRPKDAATIEDDELREFIGAVLGVGRSGTG
jgi:uncharacterized protein YdhG (YjbR/CyaY superfamily)